MVSFANGQPSITASSEEKPHPMTDTSQETNNQLLDCLVKLSSMLHGY